MRWGEAGGALLAALGGRAMLLPGAIDFGDNYAEIVRAGQAAACPDWPAVAAA